MNTDFVSRNERVFSLKEFNISCSEKEMLNDLEDFGFDVLSISKKIKVGRKIILCAKNDNAKFSREDFVKLSYFYVTQVICKLKNMRN